MGGESSALPWRMRTSTLWLIVVSVLVAGLLWLWISVADPKGMKVVINWVTLGRNTLTFAGLLWAALRSTGAQRVIADRMRRWWRRLRYGGISATIQVEGIAATGGMGSVTVRVHHGFSEIDRETDLLKRLVDRTDRLLLIINSLEDRNTNTQGQLNELRGAVDRARAEARSDNDKVRADASAELDRFATDMKRSDVLDLRWAVAGTFFSMFGALLTVVTG